MAPALFRQRRVSAGLITQLAFWCGQASFFRLLAVGAMVLAAGHGLLLAAVSHVGVGGSIVPLIRGLILIGAGMGLMIVPLTSTIMSGVAPEQVPASRRRST